MIDDKRLLGLIPARGGSKRLPRKNILDLAGKPLMAWSIEAGLQSKYIDRVVVSTEDEEIANLSRQYGADVPFMRNKGLASDTAQSFDVVLQAVNVLRESGDIYDYLILLQPTSPLRTAKNIDDAVELLLNMNANGVVGVCELDHPVEWTTTLSADCSMTGLFTQKELSMRSQDAPKRYRINGAIYLVRISNAIEDHSMILSSRSYALIMGRFNSIDIDEKIDLIVAGTILRELES